MARNNNLQYILSGEDEQCLQIILEVNNSILVNCNSICWMSDQITVEKIDSFFSFLFNSKTDNLRLSNLSLPNKFIGLAQKNNGRIFIMKRNENLQNGIYFFKDSFICGHNIPEINTRSFPDYGYERNLFMAIPYVKNRVRSLLYCVPPINSTIFFQSGSEIMIKNLSRGDTILINLWSVVAFDDTCTVKIMNISEITYDFTGSQGIMLRVQGPGNVYFSSHGKNQQQQDAMSQLSQRIFNPRLLCLNFLLYLLLIYFLLYLIGSFILDEEFMEEIRQQLENNINNRRNLGGGGLGRGGGAGGGNNRVEL